jgi:hypothetical protein
MEALSRLMPAAKVRSSGTPLALAPSNQDSSAEAFLFRIICQIGLRQFTCCPHLRMGLLYEVEGALVLRGAVLRSSQNQPGRTTARKAWVLVVFALLGNRRVISSWSPPGSDGLSQRRQVIAHSGFRASVSMAHE